MLAGVNVPETSASVAVAVGHLPESTPDRTDEAVGGTSSAASTSGSGATGTTCARTAIR